MRKFSDELKSLHEQSVYNFINKITNDIKEAASKGERSFSIRIDNRIFLEALKDIINDDEGISISGLNDYYTIKWNVE